MIASDSARAWLNACGSREIDDDEGARLLRIVRRGSGSVVTWRRAQMVLLSAQGMPVAIQPVAPADPCPCAVLLAVALGQADPPRPGLAGLQAQLSVN